MDASETPDATFVAPCATCSVPSASPFMPSTSFVESLAAVDAPSASLSSPETSSPETVWIPDASSASVEERSAMVRASLAAPPIAASAEETATRTSSTYDAVAVRPAEAAIAVFTSRATSPTSAPDPAPTASEICACGSAPVGSDWIAAIDREKPAGIVRTAWYAPEARPSAASAADVVVHVKPSVTSPAASCAARSAPRSTVRSVPSACGTVVPSSRSTTAAGVVAPPPCICDQTSRPAKVSGTSAARTRATASRGSERRPGSVAASRTPPSATATGTTAPASFAPDGHHARSPTSVVMAGTRIDRTRKVSMRTPIATATPTWNRTMSGAVAMEPKVPARMRPADVMTAPVRPDAMRIPSRIGRVSLSSRTRLMRKML